MAFAATALMGGICLHLCVFVCVCMHILCVFISPVCLCVCGALWFTAPLNPIQSEAWPELENEQHVDVC